MLHFCNQNKGAISIFLTLILLPVILLGGLTTDAARIYTSRVVISDAGEMAMNAGLAQYEDTLHDEYGLLVMSKSPESMQDDLATYFNKSLNGSGLSNADNYSRILDMVTEKFEAINLVGSEIYKTEVEKQQIVEYMKYRAPVCLTELIIDKFGELKDTKKKAKAMESQMDFAEAMEDCQDSMEDAKNSLDSLNSLLKSYPAKETIQAELAATQLDYTTIVSKCLLMLAAISHYTDAAGGDAELCAKSYIGAVSGVQVNDNASDQNSFEAYMNGLYYKAGVDNDGGLQKVLNDWKAKEPDEEDTDYSDWKERMDELKELKTDYDAAVSSVSGYPNQLRKIAYENYIVPHSGTLSGYWELSEKGSALAQTAYQKLEKVQKNLKEAKEKWQTWSDDTDALGDSAGEMKNSVDDYGKFFSSGDGSADMDNLEQLMATVQTDQQFFKEMSHFITGEKFFEQSIAMVSAENQYSTFLNQTNAVADETTDTFMEIEAKRESYKNNYVHVEITTSCNMGQIKDDRFYQRLIEYCKEKSTEESETEKSETNAKLDESESAGSEAEETDGYPDYTWTMDDSMPSVLLGLVSSDEANSSLTSVGGNVNDKSGRKSALKKFRESISEASSFLDGLDRIVSDNLENLYVAEYAMQLFSYYTVDKDKGTTLEDDKIAGLSGYKLSNHKAYKAEIEYILWGNQSSELNVKYTIMTIFGIRMLFNSFFAFTNTKIGRIAKTGAEAIAGAAPYLIPVVQAIIELAFAGIETADDMKQIKAGYGVTIVKKPKYWKTFAIDGLRTGNNTEGVTLDYSEFLRIFLNLNMLGGKEVEKLARIADCIKVNTDFDMKNGYTMLAIEAKVKVRTTFMRKISDMGSGTWTEDSYPVLYQSVLGY